ncbi:MAG: hypothetical protein M3417_09385 [Actinomycetota bacterium]|nr:hypothetical protein [Actinomycetota bacterium]
MVRPPTARREAQQEAFVAIVDLADALRVEVVEESGAATENWQPGGQRIDGSGPLELVQVAFVSVAAPPMLLDRIAAREADS